MSNSRRGVVSRANLHVERQLDSIACGFACAVMLAADRGVMIQQVELLRRWRWAHMSGTILGSLSPESLARLLTEELGRGVWKGGDTSLAAPADVFEALASRSWAALLGAGRLGHWVVVDGRDRHGRVLVRDPEGLRSTWPMRAFLEAWYHQEAVFEVSDG